MESKSIGAQLEELRRTISSGLGSPTVVGATHRKDKRLVVLFPLPTEYSTTHGGNNPVRVRKVQVTVSAPSCQEAVTLHDEVVSVVQNLRLETAGEYASTVKVSNDDFGSVAVADRLEDGQVYSYMTLEWSE